MWPVALLVTGIALVYMTTRGVPNLKEVKSTVDGKMYDVSKMDSALTPFIHPSQTQTNKVIDVDWS